MAERIKIAVNTKSKIALPNSPDVAVPKKPMKEIIERIITVINNAFTSDIIPQRNFKI